jgi:hypothetical protein
MFSSCHGDISKQYSQELILLPETIEVFKEWEKKQYKIVLVTGRRESHRAELEGQLKRAGLFWDKLVMGLPNGPRIVVNDVKDGGEMRAWCYNVVRNTGIGELKEL